MSRHQTGPKNGQWKGGRVVEPRGYVLIRVGKDHPLADCRGYAYEHRLVAWKAGQRVRGRDVHHEDERKGNNAPGNLKAVTRGWHRFEHRTPRKDGRRLRLPGERNPLVQCACRCGTTFRRFDSSGRPRRFVTGHNTGARHGS